jgi:hypothetical protein
MKAQCPAVHARNRELLTCKLPLEGNRRFCPLSQIINPLAGHKHLRLEGHLGRVLIADPMKEASDIACSSSVVSKGQGGVKKRFVCQCT